MSKKSIAGGAVGPLIMFDGPDEVGKSTQLRLAAEELRRRGYEVYTTRINGGTPIGEAIRRIYLDASLQRPRQTDLHLMMASYYALAEDLAQKRQRSPRAIYLVDRSPLSMLAYHAYAGGLEEAGRRVTEESLHLFAPTMIICYQAPLELLQQRRGHRLAEEQRSPDFVESQPITFMRQVLKGYTEAAQTYGAHVIDASRAMASVHQATMLALRPVLPPQPKAKS